jgi:tetratricopeptide (TPR) repeat protein
MHEWNEPILGRDRDGVSVDRGGSRRENLRWTWLTVGLVLAATATARAGFQSISTVTPGPTAAIEMDAASKAIPEVEKAIKSFESRDFDGSLKLLIEAVKKHPELPPANVLFAKLAFQGNQGALIHPALERAAIEAPGHPEVYLLCGNVALLEGRTTDASVHFEKAEALAAGKAWTPEQRKRFQLLGDQGAALVAESRSDWKAARAALTDWLAQEPANGKARQRLGKALFSLGLYPEAQKELQKAAKDDASLEPAAVSMGWLYSRAGNGKKAEEWMDYAVKTAPDSLSTRMGVAAWMLEQGRADDAKAQTDAALKLDPRSSEVKRLVGLVARQRKDLGEAERIFQELSVESPGDAWVRNQLALVLAEQPGDSKHRRALELAELSVRQNPNAADALTTVGIVYYRLQRLDEAEKVLQAVVGSGKGSSDAAYMLARVRADRGHADAAPALLKTALDAPGLFIFRKDAQQWLDRLTSSSK